MSKLNYYKPSGNISSIFYLYAIISLFLIIPLLSLAYAYTIFYMPFRVLNIAVFVVTLFVLFFINASTFELGKVRNIKLIKISSWILVLWFYYLHWSIWLNITITDIDAWAIVNFQINNTILPSNFALVLHPSIMWSYITTVDSIGLVFIWLIEFLGFAVVAYYSSFIDELKPYSEEADNWHERKEISILPIQKEALLQAISNQDYNWFETIQNTEIRRDDYYELVFYISPAKDNYLSLNKLTAEEEEEKGNISFNSETLIENVAINTRISDIITQLDKKGETEVKEPEIELKTSSLENKNVKNIEHKSTINKTPIITKPEIIIKVNDNKLSKRILVSIVSLLVGVFIIVLAASNDHTQGLVFGGIIILGSFFSLINNMTKTGKKEFAFKLNPSQLFISDVLSSTGNVETILMDEIKEVTHSISRDGDLKIIIIFKNLIIADNDHINLDIELAKTDWTDFLNKLNSMVDKSTTERVKILDNWSIDPKAKSNKRR